MLLCPDLFSAETRCKQDEQGHSGVIHKTCRLSPQEQAVTDGRESVAVAVRSKQLLATSFHPELTEDSRW